MEKQCLSVQSTEYTRGSVPNHSHTNNQLVSGWTLLNYSRAGLLVMIILIYLLELLRACLYGVLISLYQKYLVRLLEIFRAQRFRGVQ
jgi:hypothetical protein